MTAAPVGAAVPRAAAIRVVLAGCLLLAVPLVAFTGVGSPPLWVPPVLAAAIAVSELAVLHLTFGRQRWTYSCTDSLIAAAFALAPGGWLVPVVAVGVLVAQRVRRQPRLKAGFNVAQFTLAASAAAAIDAVLLHHRVGPFPAAVGAMAVFWLLNHTLVTTALALSGPGSLRRLLVASAPLSVLHVAGDVSVGLLAGWLAVHAPVGLLGLLVPVGLLWSSYEQQTRRAGEAALFAELAHGQERAVGRSVDASAEVVVTVAARMFGGADVELLVLSGPEPVLYRGDGTGATAREVVGPPTLGRPWVLRALGSPGLTMGVEDGRPFGSIRVGPRDRPLALLVGRRPAGSAALGRRDGALVEALAAQAENWFDVAGLVASRDAALTRVVAAGQAAKALGDLGAQTAPALTLLHDSAARLARLTVRRAETPAVLDRIVQELHAAERAVASLLGAVALAAESDLAAEADPLSARASLTPGAEPGVGAGPGWSHEPAWTSTGTLP